MKNSFNKYGKSLALMLCLTMNLSATVLPEIHFPEEEDKEVLLERGTEITLELADELRAKDLTEGRVVRLKVYKNVVSGNRKVLIKKGGYAEGRITRIRKPGILGRGGLIEFQIHAVYSVNGERLPASGKFTSHGKNRKLFATISAIGIPGLICFVTPWGIAFSVTGLAIRGSHAVVRNNERNLVSAFISKDIMIKP